MNDAALFYGIVLGFALGLVASVFIVNDLAQKHRAELGRVRGELRTARSAINHLASTVSKLNFQLMAQASILKGLSARNRAAKKKLDKWDIGLRELTEGER